MTDARADSEGRFALPDRRERLPLVFTLEAVPRDLPGVTWTSFNP